VLVSSSTTNPLPSQMSKAQSAVIRSGPRRS
jgi:hypothetical protein